MPSPSGGTVTYNFSLDQDVYVITTCDNNTAVRPGTVIRIRIEVLATITTIIYDVRLDDATISLFDEEDVFGTKAEALTELGTRIT